MLHLAAFWLAIIPPALALLVECFNPVNSRTVKASIERDIDADFPGLIDRDDLVTVMQKAGTAIAEIAGLAPTLIASTTSGFAILHELASPFWPAVIYVLVAMAAALYLLWLLSGLTFSQIDGRNAAIPLPFVEIGLDLKRTTMVSLAIYAANGALIALAVVVFSMKEEPSSASAQINILVPQQSLVVNYEMTPLEAVADSVEHSFQDIGSQIAELQAQVAGVASNVIQLKEQITHKDIAPTSELTLGISGWQRIQTALAQRGFSPGTPDGIPGPRTRNAIRGFQHQKADGSSVDGRLTSGQLAELWEASPSN